MKEHIGPITGLRMRSNDEEVASSSGDGSIIIWCLKKFIRKALVLQDTLFLDVCWHPAECQVCIPCCGKAILTVCSLLLRFR